VCGGGGGGKEKGDGWGSGGGKGHNKKKVNCFLVLCCVEERGGWWGCCGGGGGGGGEKIKETRLETRDAKGTIDKQTTGIRLGTAVYSRLKFENLQIICFIGSTCNHGQKYWEKFTLSALFHSLKAMVIWARHKSNSLNFRSLMV